MSAGLRGLKQCLSALIVTLSVFSSSCYRLPTKSDCELHTYSIVKVLNFSDESYDVCAWRARKIKGEWKTYGKPVCNHFPPLVEGRLRTWPGYLYLEIKNSEPVAQPEGKIIYTTLCGVTTTKIEGEIVYHDLTLRPRSFTCPPGCVPRD